MTFRSSDIQGSPADPIIFAIDSFRPDDLVMLIGAAGAISTEGGVISHLGVCSRSFGKPAISLHQCSVDERSKVLHTPIGMFKESEAVVVDGTNGCLTRLPDYALEKRWIISQDANLETVIKLLEDLTKSDSFGALPLATQIHFSHLRQQARDAGLLE